MLNPDRAFVPLDATGASPPAPVDEWRPILPVPADAPKLFEDAAARFCLAGYNIVAGWRYNDTKERLLGWIVRYDHSTKKTANGKKDKQFRPFTFCEGPGGKREWRCQGFPDPRPLYGLDRLAARPNAPVLVTEGEKDADGATKRFGGYVAVTSPGGSGSAEKADWSVLKGCCVVIWPDNDAKGTKYAGDVARLAMQAGTASVAIVQVPADFPPTFGLADPLPDGITDDDIARLLAEAKPVEPGPAYLSFGSFEMTDKGLTVELTGRGKNKRTETIWIASSFEILGASRDPQGHNWGKWLRWRDADGRQHLRHVGDAALQGDPAALCAALADDGLKIDRAAQRHLAAYLSSVVVEGRVTIVHRTGWHDIHKEFVFVLPQDAIGPRGAEQVILDAAARGPYEARGTLQEWQASVGKLASGHVLPVLAISAAFAGPLLYLAGQEGGGVHFYGASSRGKTTLLQMAASVWGRGTSPGFIRSWRATANGLEGAAAGATDTALILDELGQVDPREAAAAFYSLANGAGKQRAARDGSLREPRSWRLMFISSGEIPAETKLAEDRGRKARAGQMVRLLDIAVDRPLGAFDHHNGYDDAGSLAKACKQGSMSAHGVAGPEFVRRLIAEGVTGDEVRAAVSVWTKEYAPVDSDGQIDRGAQRFGVMAAAGELATRLGVTPWQEGEAQAAAAWALRQWIDGRGGTEAAEVRQAIQQVRLFIEQHGEARFENLDDADARPPAIRAGYRKGSGAQREWWVLPETWKSEVCAGLDATFVARVLAGAGMLRRQDDRRLQCSVRVGDQTPRAYVLTASILDGGEHG